MAKRQIRKHSSFDLAIRQMSIAQLKKLAAHYKKGTSNCETRDDYVGRLVATMTNAEQIHAMQNFVLAGRTAMTIYALEGSDKEAKALVKDFDFTSEFDGVATREPEIVTVGKPDELFKGLQHVQWAMVTGQQNYLDIHLALKVEPESVVYNSFYEQEKKFLQVRASALYAKKIAMRWAKLVGIDFERSAKRVCLTTPDEVEQFCTHLSGTVKKCSGNKRESKGMHRMSGTRHPNIADLRGTEDYATFLNEVDPADFQIEFDHAGKSYAIGISIEMGSLSFLRNAPETTIQYIYSELKKFLKV